MLEEPLHGPPHVVGYNSSVQWYLDGDFGTPNGATSDACWNDKELSCLKSLILDDFEPVNASSLMVHNDSGATKQ